MFKKLFSKKAKAGFKLPPNGAGAGSAATIDAMQDLNEREELLEKKKAILEDKIEEEMEKAREFARQKRNSQAMMSLKKKKMYEQQREKLDALVSRVLEQKGVLEEQQYTLGVLGDLAKASEAQRKTMKAMRIENVDTVLEEVQDLGSQLRQINEAVTQPSGFYNEIDNEEIMRELAELEQEEEVVCHVSAPAALPAGKVVVAAGQRMPIAPTRLQQKKQQQQQQKSQEELELEELQAQLAM